MEHYGRMGNSCDGARMWAATRWAEEQLESSDGLGEEKGCHKLQADTEMGHG